MTLVSLSNSSSSSNNFMPMMLSVQSQYNSQPMGSQRGNVIVANANSSDVVKMQTAQKKKMYASTTPCEGPQQPASVARRNARERNRVKQVNNGFATLRQHIPQSLAQALGSNTAGTQGGARAGSKKLSKVETLRMAVEYIRNLQELLDEHDAETGGAGRSQQSIKFELKSESGDEQYQQQVSPVTYTQPACSEASSSPTPSFVSDSSTSSQQQYTATFATTGIYPAHDSYDNYEPMSPEEEVLLDYISSNYIWPQAQ